MFKPSWPHLAICWSVLAISLPGHTQPPQAEDIGKRNPPSRTDLYGDPLPAGSIARMGTVRWRHPQAISFVAFLPDGKSVLSACQDQIIRLWDVKTGKEIRRFGKPLSFAQESDFLGIWQGRFRSARRMAMPYRAALSVDAKLLACGGQDGPMRLWDVESGKEIHKIDGPGLKIAGGFPVIGVPGLTGMSNLALAPDGKTVAGTGLDGTIHLWATSTAKEIRQIAQPENQNMPMAIGSSWDHTFRPIFRPRSRTIP